MAFYIKAYCLIMYILYYSQSHKPRRVSLGRILDARTFQDHFPSSWCCSKRSTAYYCVVERNCSSYRDAGGNDLHWRGGHLSFPYFYFYFPSLSRFRRRTTGNLTRYCAYLLAKVMNLCQSVTAMVKVSSVVVTVARRSFINVVLPVRLTRFL